MIRAVVKTDSGEYLEFDLATLNVEGVAISAASIRQVTYQNMQGQRIIVPVDDTPTTQHPVIPAT